MDTIVTRPAPVLPAYSTTRQYTILVIVSFAGLLGPVSSNIYYPALPDLEKDFNASEVLVDLTVSLFVLFTGIAPLFWAPFSDSRGRKAVYLVSLVIYIATSVACALSVNIAMFLVMRTLQACGSSSVIAVGAGTISDVFPPEKRGAAMGLFFMGPLVGPLLGPIVGGYMSEYAGWRVIFYFLAGLGAFVFLVILFFLPETLAHRRLALIDPSLPPPPRKRHGPIDTLKILRFPTVYFTVFYVSVILGSVYLITTHLPRAFAQVYHLSSGTIGLTYLATGVGNVVGSIVGGRMTDWVMRRERLKRGPGEKVPPEYRLLSAYVGSILLPPALMGYGWVVEKEQPLYAALICLFFIGIGMMFVFTACSTFLIDAFPSQSASAVSVNNFCRSLLAAVGALVSDPATQAIGSGWLMVICGTLCILGTLFLVAIHRWGHSWPKPV